MSDRSSDPSVIDRQVARLFALVTEALAGATHVLLSGEVANAQLIVDADQTIDDLTHEVNALVWDQIESGTADRQQLRHLVNLLLILPELERSADLAEHIAKRAATNLGVAMSPVSRGFVQRMSEVALEMWQTVAISYLERSSEAMVLDEADEEIDTLRDRLTQEVASETMPTNVASEVTLLGRFYERLGDHAVNLARRIGSFTDP